MSRQNMFPDDHEMRIVCNHTCWGAKRCRDIWEGWSEDLVGFNTHLVVTTISEYETVLDESLQLDTRNLEDLFRYFIPVDSAIL